MSTENFIKDFMDRVIEAFCEQLEAAGKFSQAADEGLKIRVSQSFIMGIEKVIPYKMASLITGAPDIATEPHIYQQPLAFVSKYLPQVGTRDQGVVEVSHEDAAELDGFLNKALIKALGFEQREEIADTMAKKYAAGKAGQGAVDTYISDRTTQMGRH